MPADSRAPRLSSPFIKRLFEQPLTAVLPLEAALKVELLAGPSREQLEAKLGPVRAAHAMTPPRSGDATDELTRLFSGKGLWQVLETLEFDLLVTGCTRVFTHQLVRTRIGVSFSQQGTGDTDCRHMDCLLPSAYPYGVQQDIITGVLASKMLYCKLVDEYRVPEQDARYILPHCLGTFIYIHANLACLSELYKKRTCSMTQAWETKLFADRLREALLKAYPVLVPAFASPCDAGTCWYQRAKDTPFAVSHLWTPDAQHDRFPWRRDSFFYGEHEKVSTGYPVAPRWYIGEYIVTESEYRRCYDERAARRS